VKQNEGGRETAAIAVRGQRRNAHASALQFLLIKTSREETLGAVCVTWAKPMKKCGRRFPNVGRGGPVCDNPFFFAKSIFLLYTIMSYPSYVFYESTYTHRRTCIWFGAL